MKLIGLDVGTKRIGVAKADSAVRIAIPYQAVEVDGNEFKKIASLARAWDIRNFVIGLPRSNEGNETKQSLYVRNFAKILQKSVPGIKICFQDESLTSVEAEKRLKGRKKGYKKGDIDSEAAAIILQDFLEEKTGKSTTRVASASRRSVKGNRPHRFATAIVALLILIGLAGGVSFAYYNYQLQPVAAADCEDNSTEASACTVRGFTVSSGAAVSDVATSLKEQNLIRDALVFQVYYRLNNRGEQIKAGEYEFTQAMPTSEIVSSLLSGSDGVFTLTVFPGERLSELRKKLISLGYSDDEITAAFEKDYRHDAKLGWLFEGMPEEAKSLEGYLFGDTHEFYLIDDVDTIVHTLISGLAEAAEENDLRAKFAERGLNLYQGITLASIVQREADSAEDMAKVAQIFYNRLHQTDAETAGMLGSDITAQYAADLIDPARETYTDNLAVTEIDSPYNTRKYAGLPYGPVSNPGINALNAVASPDESVADMLYFLTGDDGVLYTSSTADGHEQNRLDHCQVLCNIGL